MSESEKKLLDPLDQNNWNKLGNSFSGIFDDFLDDLPKKETEDASEKDVQISPSIEVVQVVENQPKDTSVPMEKDAAKKIDGKEKINNQQREKIKKLRADIVAILEREEFNEYKKSKANKKRLTSYKRTILIQAQKDFNRIDEIDAMEALLNIAKKSKIAKVILEEIKENMEKESEAELKKEDDLAKNVFELTDKEKKDAVDFFDKDVLPLYEVKKGEKNWNGFNSEVREFLKEQFFATAEMNTLFLDGDDAKIVKAWETIEKDIEEKVKAIEDKLSKIDQPIDVVAGEKTDWTLEEVYKKLSAAGAEDVDIKYFFNLPKKDRMDFLNSSDEDLVFRIEKLKEKREADEEKISNNENQDEEDYNRAREEKLKYLGEDMTKKRAVYLKKEYEMNKISAKMKRFFNRIGNLDLGNAEEEVENLRNEYKNSLVAYSNAIVDIEGINDQEEREIMLNYYGVSAAINLQEERMEIKNENDPRSLQLMKDVFSGVFRGYLKGYKKTATYLSTKAVELVSKKTDSKLAKLAGGLSGGMAFSIGLSNIFKTTGAPYWVTKSILLATSTAAMTMENKEAMDKELSENESKEIEERKIAALREMESKIQDELALAMKKIFAVEANTSLDYQKDKEAINKKMWLKAFGKAAGKNLFFYSAGFGASELIKDFTEFLVDLKEDVFGGEKEIVPEIKDINTKESLDKTATNIHGGDLHLKSNPMGAPSQTENIYETMNRLGIKSGGESNIPEDVSPKDVAQTHREEFFKDNEEIPSEEPIQSLIERESVEIPEIEKNVFDGIELDSSGRGEIKIIEGMGVKDSLAKFLADNSDKLTEGNMGWNPDNKYESVQDWADRRAVGIVAELREQHPDYDLDRVFTKDKIVLDMHDKADIKIIGINVDELEGGAEKSADSDMENSVDSSSNDSALEEKREMFKENILAEAKKMTTNEMSIAYSAGVAADEYARINNLTVEEFLANKDETTSKLREMLQTLNEQQLLESPNVSVSEALRNIDEEEFAGIFGAKNLDGFRYEEYLGGILKKELSEMIQMDSQQRSVFEALLKIRGENVNNLNSDIFQAFKDSIREKLGIVEVNGNTTVGTYVLKAIRKAYEMGEMDDFKLALSRVKL